MEEKQFKTTKKSRISKKHSATLDGKHNEFLDEFFNIKYNIIPSLKKELKDLEEQLTKLDGQPSNIEKIMDVKDQIRDIKLKIKALKKKRNDYYLNNSKFIFEYFETKKNIDNLEDTSKQSKNNLLYCIFKVNAKDVDGDDTNTADSNKKLSENKTITNNLVQKYLTNIDESFLNMELYVRDFDVCQYCHKGELIPVEDEGVLICNRCSSSVKYLIENEKPSYKEPPKEVCFYAYKRINHFKEVVAQHQGKETTQIPDELILRIQRQIKKERITLEELTYCKMRDMLHQLASSNYYEHIAFIKNKLGIKPPVFSPELEDTLFNLFLEIQAPYSKFHPDNRVNFLNYHFVLYKFCELLGETEYLKGIPLLKDREKLIEQDDTWKKICHEKNWCFIPTV